MKTNTIKLPVKIAFILLLAIVAAAYYFYLQYMRVNEAAYSPLDQAGNRAEQITRSDTTGRPAMPAVIANSSQQSTEPGSQDEFKARILERLLAQYSGTIQSVAAQASLLELRDFIRQQYPAEGDTIFQELITRAFPDYVKAILAAIAKMDQYNTWYLDNLLDLNEMNSLARNGSLWQKRTELFGEAAREIWSEELTAKQEREQSMQQTVKLLDKADDTPIDERLYILQSTLQENYANTPESLVLGNGMVAGVFFSMASVQKDLAAMSPEARQAKINDLRRQMGYDDKQIEQLQKTDQAKEKRWQNGYAYMAARDELIASYQGLEGDSYRQQERDDRLLELQNKFFGREAITIAMEEKNGFFRYKRPRVFGRN